MRIKSRKLNVYTAKGMKKFSISIAATTCLALLLCSASASANKPVKLTDNELDGVSAGAVAVQIRAQADGANGHASASLAATSHISGNYSLDIATGVGHASVCCVGGSTSVEVSGDSSGVFTGGGSVTSTIRFRKTGSYSYGVGVQIGLSKNN